MLTEIMSFIHSPSPSIPFCKVILPTPMDSLTIFIPMTHKSFSPILTCLPRSNPESQPVCLTSSQCFTVKLNSTWPELNSVSHLPRLPVLHFLCTTTESNTNHSVTQAPNLGVSCDFALSLAYQVVLASIGLPVMSASFIILSFFSCFLPCQPLSME